jgi:hypothetical protein
MAKSRRRNVKLALVSSVRHPQKVGCLPTKLARRPRVGYTHKMFIKSIRMGFVGVFVSAVSAWAAGSGVEGVVKDSNHKPVANAEVHIDAKDGVTKSKIVKTDSSGHYSCPGLPAGDYKVTLLVAGAVKATINNSTVRTGSATALNFDLKGTAAAKAPLKPHTHMVYVPSETGSHLGGRWVEVNDNGDNSAATASDNGVRRASASALKGFQSNSGGMGNSNGGN